MKRNLLRLFILSVMSIFALGASATPDKNYLCFTANTAGSTVALNKKKSPTEVTIEYSTNGTDWTSVDFSSKTTTGEITLNKVGDKVYFRNAEIAQYVTGFSLSTSSYYQFSMAGSIAASGNVMSLIGQDCPTTTIPFDNCFTNLFKGCSSLTSAPELPATILADHCYYYMFYLCSSLTSAPKLPATTLVGYCYSYMFSGCTGLTSAPELPATILANDCYDYMFSGCTGLTSAPELPATTLADHCYYYMFNGCTALASAPELPATTLQSYCYQSMFNGCSGLTTAPELPATILTTSCYRYMFNGCTNLNNISVAFTTLGSAVTTDWLSGVSSTGTFSWPASGKPIYSSSNIPSGWTTVTNTFDLTITDAGWASMCVNLPLQVPTGVEVYYASAVNGTTISLTQIEAGTKIAAKTAVLVKGAKGTVSFPIMGEAGKSYSGNLFKGTSVDKPKTEDVYVLSGVGTTGNPQFQNYAGTTLGAHKIWLPKSAVGGSTGAINFVFDDATAINGMDAATPKSSVRYNLNGQAVGADYKGIVIVNGKKYINK